MIAKWLRTALVFFAAVLLSFTISAKGRYDTALGKIAYANLPLQGQQTLTLIKQGGPFPYSKDGAVFGNHEASLPHQPRGYYREYTVPTPGAHNRGARRIISGGSARSGEYYYTDDHYASFKHIVE